MSWQANWTATASWIATLLVTESARAAETAQTPRISGDVWVAVAVVAVLVAVLALFIRGILGMEQHDARLGRDDDDDGATPLLF